MLDANLRARGRRYGEEVGSGVIGSGKRGEREERQRERRKEGSEEESGDNERGRRHVSMESRGGWRDGVKEGRELREREARSHGGAASLLFLPLLFIPPTLSRSSESRSEEEGDIPAKKHDRILKLDRGKIKEKKGESEETSARAHTLPSFFSTAPKHSPEGLTGFSEYATS